MHLYPEELLCPYLARLLGVPVKWWESRSESHQSTNHGRAHTETIERHAQRRQDTRLKSRRWAMSRLLSNMATGADVNTINFGPGYKIENYEPAPE